MDSIIKGFDPTPVSSAGYRAESGSLNAGGEAVNGSIAAAKLGLKAAILCSLGNDGAGDMIAEELERHGVDTSRIVRSDERPTPITTIFVAEDGERMSITNSAHKKNFHPERYEKSFTDAGAIVIGSLFRAPFNDVSVVEAVVRAAAANGVLVIADTKLPNFTVLTLDDLAEALPYIDYITPNEAEARFFTGQEEPEKMADVFLSRGVRNVIIKLGPKGCFFKNSEESFCLPAFRVDTVDATGAGDNFLAGFASEIIRGSSVRDALTFASACGAICSTAVGSGTALEGRQQVLGFLEKRQTPGCAAQNKAQDGTAQNKAQDGTAQKG